MEIAIHLNELHLAVASLARKLGNLKLAEKFLLCQVTWMTKGMSQVQAIDFKFSGPSGNSDAACCLVDLFHCI